MVTGPDPSAQMWHRMVSKRTALAKVIHETEYQAKDGFGGDGFMVDPDEWEANRVMYGKDCWKDPDFRKAWARDNPEFVWKAKRGTRGQQYKGTRHLTKDFPRGTILVPNSYPEPS